MHFTDGVFHIQIRLLSDPHVAADFVHDIFINLPRLLWQLFPINLWQLFPLKGSQIEEATQQPLMRVTAHSRAYEVCYLFGILRWRWHLHRTCEVEIQIR